MKSGWQKYLLYASIVIVGGFILFETLRLKNTGFEGKSLWDWMELLIIPAVLAGGAFFLNRSERNTEREIAADRQKEAALQSYLDRMSELLLEKDLTSKYRSKKERNKYNVARIRTLTVLRSLDGNRKGFVINFLNEANLIRTAEPIVDLDGADLQGANLRMANLNGANLRNTNMQTAILQDASLKEANLEYANLFKANLYLAFLQGANLYVANLRSARLGFASLDKAILKAAFLEHANLQNAYLKNANLQLAILTGANLNFADLKGVNLQGARLWQANLEGANLEETNLMEAEVSLQQLAKAKSLKGATMPDGTIHE